METNQPSTKIIAEDIGHIAPVKKKSDVLLIENSSSVTEKVPEANPQTQAKLRKCGILRRVTQTPDRMQRSRTEISISQKFPETLHTEKPKNTLTPPKTKHPCTCSSVKKGHPNAILKTSHQSKLISRKKSQSSLELQFQINRTEPIKTNKASKTSKLSTPRSVTKQWSISSAGMQIAALPVKAIHKLGTIPSYLEPHKKCAHQSQFNKRQKAFNDCKKDCIQMQATLFEKHDDLVKIHQKLKNNSGANEIVLEKLEFLPIIGTITGSGDAVEQASTVNLVPALELANFNILRYVETEMKKISDCYLKRCQDFLDTHFNKDIDSESTEDLRCFFKNSMLKLSENIAQMKIEQETMLSSCQAELKSMLINNVKSGTCNSVQDLIIKTEEQNARQLQQLNEQIEELQKKILAAEQQNKILEQTKTDNETNREKELKTTIFKRDKDISKYFDKCNRLEVLNKGNDRKIAEMEAKLKEPIAEAERLVGELEATKKQLCDSTQQYNQLKVQVTEMRRKHQQSIAENEDKLSQERQEKDKIQADLIHAKEAIDQFRNQRGGERSCGDVENLAATIKIESQQCIINEKKEEIQECLHERQRLLDILDITQHKFKLYDRRLQNKNAVIYKLEHKLREETKRLYDSEASMQVQIVNLKRLDEKKQSELDSLRTQLSRASAELRQKDENVGMDNTLCVRNELIELIKRECPESVPCKWLDQQNIDILTYSENFSNLFSTLSDKQITVSQQHLIIKRLEEHQTQNAIARAQQIEHYQELEAENERLSLELSACSRRSTFSAEIYQNSIDLTSDSDRKHKVNI